VAKKTSVKITGVREVGQAIQKAINVVKLDDSLFKDIGEYTVKNIVGSARLGQDPDKKALANISNSWDKRRKRLATVNQTDEFFKPSVKRSRLTFTGQLLKSFTFKYNKTALSLSFLFAGNRKPYKGIRKPNLDGLSTNAELAEEIEKDRPFVFLGEKMRESIKSKITNSIKRGLRNYKKLSKLLG
jgi:hypothetical protein